MNALQVLQQNVLRCIAVSFENVTLGSAMIDVSVGEKTTLTGSPWTPTAPFGACHGAPNKPIGAPDGGSRINSIVIDLSEKMSLGADGSSCCEPVFCLKMIFYTPEV